MTGQTKAKSLLKEWYAPLTLRQRLDIGKKMADELRRIESNNTKMLDALKKISAIEIKMCGLHFDGLEDARNIANEAIAKVTRGTA